MFLARRSLGKFSTAPLSRRFLSNRASAVLGVLDIPTTPTELPGVYDGEWKGSGEVFQSVCPATGEVLANVKSVRPYHNALRVSIHRGLHLNRDLLTTLTGITSGAPCRAG